jgi:CheY-like chemotaxis protein
MGLSHAEKMDELPGRVLVVDDNAELRQGYCRILARVGHTAVEARDGAEAVALIAGGNIDVVVSDVHMPDMTGIELLQHLHEVDPDLPVLLVSGAPDLDSALKAVRYGALEYLEKPINMAKLRASVGRGLELRRRAVAVKGASGVHAKAPALAAALAGDIEGQVIGGRYKVGPLLGEGGMGAVYEGTREDLGAMPVAIKVLRADATTDAGALRRFRREAHLLASINHPNIVRILDFQAPPDEPAFIVMERLYGTSLGDAIRRERHFSPDDVAWIGVQVLGALEAAHAVGVVHRDLKPDNVFLLEPSTVRDVVKLLDFGIAKLCGPSGQEALTQTGTVLGTPAYMAPEQARGEQADRRSDLYAVGCLLFEALTGRPPFVGDNYNAVVFQAATATPPAVSELRPDVDVVLAAVIAKAMAKDPAYRFQSASDLSEALSHWVSAAPCSRDNAPNSSPAAFAVTMMPPAETRKRPRRRRAPSRKSG